MQLWDVFPGECVYIAAICCTQVHGLCSGQALLPRPSHIVLGEGVVGGRGHGREGVGGGSCGRGKLWEGEGMEGSLWEGEVWEGEGSVGRVKVGRREREGVGDGRGGRNNEVYCI